MTSDKGTFVPNSATSVRSARGGAYVLVGALAGLAIQLVALLTLSRLLPPSDFGLIAMVAVFVSLGSLLRDFGLPLAGLQEQTLTRQQASNLFWMNGAIGAACGGLFIASAPFISSALHEPRLTGIIPPMALVVFVGGISAQLQVLLARSLRFGVLVASDLIGQAFALATAIALAVGGAGYWSLVAQSVVGALLTLALRWIACRWAPLAPRRGHDALRMFRAGVAYGLAQLLTFAQANIATLVIAARLGSTSVGYYNRALQLLTAPAGRFLDPLTQVVITALNRAKAGGRDPDRLLFKIQFGVGALVVWAFAVTAGTAPGLVPIILGPQWGPVVPVFQALAVGGAVWVFNHVSYWAFIMNEIPGQLLAYNLVSKPVSIAVILYGCQFGLTGAAWGYALAMSISWPINLIWLGRSAGLPAWRFFLNGCRILLAGGAAALAASVSYAILASTIAVVAATSMALLVGTLTMYISVAIFPASRVLLREWLHLLRSSVNLSTAGS